MSEAKKTLVEALGDLGVDNAEGKALARLVSFVSSRDGEIKTEQIRRAFAGEINRLNLESLSNTPDFILGRFLMAAMLAFDVGVMSRDAWYGRNIDVGPGEDASDRRWCESAVKLLRWVIERSLGEGGEQRVLNADLASLIEDFLKRYDARPVPTS